MIARASIAIGVAIALAGCLGFARTEPSPGVPPAPAAVETPPATPDGPPPEAPPEVIDKFAGIRAYPRERRVEIDGAVCLQKGGPIEVLGAAPYGKLHEALLVVNCKPQDLHLAFLLLGLAPAGEEGAPPSPLDLWVTWKDGGKEVAYPVEDLIWDLGRREAMPRANWVFQGSRFVKVPYFHEDGREEEREVFAAESTGTVVTPFHDPYAIVCPAAPAEETGPATDAEGHYLGVDNYYANYQRLPVEGTPVVLRIAPAAPR